MPASRPTLTVTLMRAGTYSIHVHRSGRPPERFRMGISDKAEAFKRAEVIAELCGYKVDRKLHTT